MGDAAMKTRAQFNQILLESTSLPRTIERCMLDVLVDIRDELVRAGKPVEIPPLPKAVSGAASPQGELVECAACAAKPGAPILCYSCSTNRTTIDALKKSHGACVEREEKLSRELDAARKLNSVHALVAIDLTALANYLGAERTARAILGKVQALASVAQDRKDLVLRAAQRVEGCLYCGRLRKVGALLAADHASDCPALGEQGCAK